MATNNKTRKEEIQIRNKAKGVNEMVEVTIEHKNNCDHRGHRPKNCSNGFWAASVTVNKQKYERSGKTSSDAFDLIKLAVYRDFPTDH